MLSSYVIDYGSGGGSLSSATSLNKKGLKTLNNIGGDKLVEHVVSTGLQIGDGLFEGEDSCAGGKIMAESSNGSVITA